MVFHTQTSENETNSPIIIKICQNLLEGDIFFMRVVFDGKVLDNTIKVLVV